MRLTLQFDSNSPDVSGNDVGYLLEKHPDRTLRKKTGLADVSVFYLPSHSVRVANVCLDVCIDVEAATHGAQSIDGYISDMPFSASSLFWKAYNEVFRSALRGVCRERQDLLTSRWMVSARLPAVNCPASLIEPFFEPLGYFVHAAPILDTRVNDIEVGHASLTIQEFLRQLYVLGLALDGRRHHAVDDAQADKLLAEAGAWLPKHPKYRAITARFLAGAKKVTAGALAEVEALQDPDGADVEIEPEETVDPDGIPLPPTRRRAETETPSLNEQRIAAVVGALADMTPGPNDVLVDLGCGTGRLLEAFAAKGWRVLGVEAEGKAARQAQFFMRRNKVAGVGVETGSVLFDLPPIYLDKKERPTFQVPEIADGEPAPTPLRVRAVVSVEVIEHLELYDVSRFLAVVWGIGAERIVITTPNRAYNATWGIPDDKYRHPDHRFEWVPAEFRTHLMALEGANLFGGDPEYDVQLVGIGGPDGNPDPNAAPTTMAILRQVRGELKPRGPATPAPWHDPRVLAPGVPEFFIPWAQRASAVEFFSRRCVALDDLVYIPPTMSPVDAALEGPELERPEDALRYYQDRGVQSVVAEEKHMGSRALALIRANGRGVLYTRNGRAFDREIAKPLLDDLQASLELMGMRGTTLVDAELLPWAAKAAGLIWKQFGPAGAALYAGSPDNRPHAEAYLAVLKHFAADGQPVRLAPFAILAHIPEKKDAILPFIGTALSHRSQMELCQQLVTRAPNQRLKSTLWVETNDPSTLRGFYDDVVVAGAEGIVVKPGTGGLNLREDNGQGRLVQPGIKVRNPEYLRLVYGPTYPDHLDRLRNRRTKRKRLLALQEHAIGLAGLAAFVAAGGRVTDEVTQRAFQVLALEAEPDMDPRL